MGNRLTGPNPADAYTYNAGHQLLAGPSTSYTWDPLDRLVQAVVTTGSGTTTLTFAYDALGRRVRKTVVAPSGSTRTTDYVYDGEAILLAIETTNTGGTPTTVTTRYVHGPGIDEPLLVETGGQVLAVHADGLGSVTGLSDASQTLVEARAYTAFGQMQRAGRGLRVHRTGVGARARALLPPGSVL